MNRLLVKRLFGDFMSVKDEGIYSDRMVNYSFLFYLALFCLNRDLRSVNDNSQQITLRTSCYERNWNIQGRSNFTCQNNVLLLPHKCLNPQIARNYLSNCAYEQHSHFTLYGNNYSKGGKRKRYPFWNAVLNHETDFPYTNPSKFNRFLLRANCI